MWRHVVVVLNGPQAETLVGDVVKACPAGIAVSTQVMLLGGKTLAQRQTGQIGYLMQLRWLCLTVSAKLSVVTEVPADGSVSPAQATGSAPALVGAAMRIYVKAGAANEPTYPSVGIIGLLGVEPERAVEILSRVLKDQGFLINSDLPQAGVQG